MSYEIIYRKQFIKVSDTEFIPMLLMGSSNCYEPRDNGKMRRERSWQNIKHFSNNKMYCTLEEMIAVAEKDKQFRIERNEETLKNFPDWENYSDKNYGYFSSLSIGGNSTRNTTFGMYKGIFIDGCKKALTIEELYELGITVIVGNGYVGEPTTLERKKHFPKTTTELINAIAELEEYYKGSNINVIVTFLNSVDRIEEVLKRKNKIARSKSIKPKKELSEYYVLKIPGFGYFNKKIKTGYRFSYSLSYLVKKFETEKQALNYIKKYGFSKEMIPEKVTNN